jgi:hypothetical protein
MLDNNVGEFLYKILNRCVIFETKIRIPITIRYEEVLVQESQKMVKNM